MRDTVWPLRSKKLSFLEHHAADCAPTVYETMEKERKKGKLHYSHLPTFHVPLS